LDDLESADFKSNCLLIFHSSLNETVLLDMNIFAKGSEWERSRIDELIKSRKTAWVVAGVASFCFVVAAISLASLVPLRRTIPYIVKQDTQTGNIEVLQSFDNRTIGSQALIDKSNIKKYVEAREQYNWWLVGTDYDLVASQTSEDIFSDYSKQFVGEKSVDKVFGEHTDRRINVLSITPSPTVPNVVTVRYERTTRSKGAVVEQPTIFVSTVAFRYIPKTIGAEADLIRNPMGFSIYAYRRDVEQAATQPIPSPAASAQPANPQPANAQPANAQSANANGVK
jgi:type IV secretion system protein VirB8